MRISIILGSIALAFMGNQVMATPPACLLACVAEVTKSSGKCSALNKIGCICNKESGDIHSCLNSKCPNNNASEAWKDFQSSCNGKSSASGSSASPKSSSKSSSSKASPSSRGSSSKASPSKASPSKASPSKASSLKAFPSVGKDIKPSAISSEELHPVTSSGAVDVVPIQSTVVEGITKDYTVTDTAAPVTTTVQGSTVYKTTDCSTTILKKRDGSSTNVTKTVSSSSSSGAAKGLQLGSGSVVLAAAAALLI